MSAYYLNRISYNMIRRIQSFYKKQGELLNSISQF